MTPNHINVGITTASAVIAAFVSTLSAASVQTALQGHAHVWEVVASAKASPAATAATAGIRRSASTFEETHDEVQMSFSGGSLSTFPQSPIDVYTSNIDAASGGDAHAMYWVYRAIRGCGGLLRDDFAHEQYMQSAPGLARYSEAIDAARDTCKPLWAEMGDVDMPQQARMWLSRAAQRGKLVAELQLIMNAPRDLATEELHDLEPKLIASALVDGSPAYWLVERYLVQTQGVGMASEAWRVLACREHRGCSADVLLQRLSYEYLPREISSIIALEEQFRSKIENGTLTLLDGGPSSDSESPQQIEAH